MPATTIQLPGPNGASDDSTELFRFDFQADSARNPVLAGANAEIWQVAGPVEIVQTGRLSGRRNADYLYLEARIPSATEDLRSVANALYAELCRAINASGYEKPIRFWNVIPHINRGDGDAESYRQFCWGRAEALEGCGFALPAATGVGGHTDELYVSVLAAKPSVAIAHYENPRQISAYDYPRQYGPRSPSFARSTRIERGGEALLLLSGTASIVQHESLHIGDLEAQCAETCRNVSALLDSVCQGSARAARNSGGGNGPGNPAHRERAVNIATRLYLRNPVQLIAMQSAFRREFADVCEPVILHSDICRRELLMEVEGLFRLESP